MIESQTTLRVARPTDHLDEVVALLHQGIRPDGTWLL